MVQHALYHMVQCDVHSMIGYYLDLQMVKEKEHSNDLSEKNHPK